MYIGHINLSPYDSESGERFVMLIKSLQLHGETQHVLVRDSMLARRLTALESITVGPIVRSAVTAYCLMPQCDLVHVHDQAAAQAGLLLTLMRSIPYVLTHRDPVPGKKSLSHAVYRRAARVICLDASDAAVLRHFEPAARIEVIPEMERRRSATAYLRVYQNSQSMPTAGSNGIQ